MAAVIASSLDTLRDCGLLKADEACGVEWLFEASSPFATAIDCADSLHLHIKVEDTDALPVGAFLDAGARLDHRREGYVKFCFPDGVNAIFSHIRIAQEEALQDDDARRPRPYVDHVGVDLRTETDAVRAVFEDVVRIGTGFGWGHAQQGGDRPVFCCHVSVARKHWLYPTCGALAGTPIEFAWGALTVHSDQAGCDLRPAPPGVECAPGTGCC
ncbi:hypothetical protein LF41_317 [Lysobacter dokdonensis DS-58]|uniref:Uncharacterized protein n=1 Tax=Lysobacter dokdonensis DS-58 TaxID=1300345 RepID=A0A0A2X0N8_9GAMM|nr:hypothetical protein [Lysobacter dokdonensis]KGQ18784.1 hypothetical protein LF41_317 [Lysobacter dokdonensis DS-58]